MLGIKLERKSEQPLKRQIYAQLREQIMDGQLNAKDELPSSRELAKTLGVSRNTVGEAYDMLIAEGFAISRQGAATQVAEGVSVKKGEQAVIREKPSQAYTIKADFRTGRPDLRQFPQYLWRQFLHKASMETPSELYGYTGPQGLPALRTEISLWLFRSRGLKINAEDIFITSGATHALHILAELLCGKGGKVLMEDPCHSGMLQTFRKKGCLIEPIPVDNQGMMTQYLQYKDPCAVYVTPSHQFPLGGILSAARRAELVRFARENGVYIIEDDYDSEFRYSGEPISPLYAMDQQNVIYVGTFSKSLFPALRIGYVVLPKPLHRKWSDIRTYMDVQNPIFEQAALAEFMRTRKLDRHIQKMRRIYGQRRRVLLELFKEAFGSGWTPYGDAAGLHVAVDFPGIQFDEAFRKGCLQNGIYITPVEKHCIVREAHQSKLLIGYGHLEHDEIREGITMLRDAMDSMI
ncbi:GntR family transcriptional regulator [Anaerobacterium chartisolvens]|uniref:GntR family transcriptional regulator n=1 Tax=Anaerobacterium chartisolvens TaxID=1297424 RepID=A0A369BEY7_9FIRM|nr:PLP-dependent aminotransferase family protein [Anaerobacterium chartisolvens]RCX20100.1 GntR family transcriptional regulator [Anaerobacterium chartisolvens]